MVEKEKEAAVDEVKEEVKEEGTEETKEEETQSDSSAVNDAEEESSKEEVIEEKLDPKLYDEFGVPWKNRAKEMERKYMSSLEKRAFEPAKKDEIDNLFDDNGEKREDLDTVLERRSSAEQRAYDIADEVIGGLARIRPEILKLKDEISKELRTVPLNQRGDEKLIRAVALMKYGEHNFKNKAETPSPKKKLVSDKKGSEVLNPSSKSGSSSEITLNESEREYAEKHRLGDKGFSNEEIRDLFKRANKN